MLPEGRFHLGMMPAALFSFINFSSYWFLSIIILYSFRLKAGVAFALYTAAVFSFEAMDHLL